MFHAMTKRSKKQEKKDEKVEAPLVMNRKRADSADTIMADFSEALDACAPMTVDSSRNSDSMQSEIGISAVDALYEQMETEAMMELLGEMQAEIMAELGPTPLAPSATEEHTPAETEETHSKKRDRTTDLLWHVVATPAMMTDFSAKVRQGQPSVAVGC